MRKKVEAELNHRVATSVIKLLRTQLDLVYPDLSVKVSPKENASKISTDKKRLENWRYR